MDSDFGMEISDDNFSDEMLAEDSFNEQDECDDMFADDMESEHDGFRDDVEADADALAGIGWGTDEDYGYYGGDSDY